MHTFPEYINPHLGKLLKAIRMDKSYIKGEGCYLYDEKNNRYLDCIASYGALPFGYNHREIWECISRFSCSLEPSFIQPSFLNAAGELAEKLISISPKGLRYVTFTNSGAESVEAAIKLCRSATGRLGILTTRNSFHGKTLGALSATGKKSYQEAFGAPVKGFDYITFGDLEALKSKLNSNPEYYAAFLVEPIQGEGGIIEPPQGYLKEVKKVCEQYGVLMVVDEVQTGLGRTGTMFACDQEDVCPDVMLLAKALGGGIMPIGACICKEEVYNEEFAMKHSSTFAANSLACRVGIKVLDILTADNGFIISEAKRKGELLRKGLSVLAEKYPEVVKSIRGRGLMLGIEFCVDISTFPNTILGIMGENEVLTPIISSYLLNIENLRVAPTLNGADVIRIEPSLNISDSQCYEVLNGIENMLKVLNQGNSAKFLSFLIGQEWHKKDIALARIKKDKAIPLEDREQGRFAFLVHPLEYKNFSELDESMATFENEELCKFLEVWNEAAGPAVISSMSLTSQNGQKAYGEFIGVMRTADELLNLPKEQVMSELKAALGIAKDRGAKIVGLGAFTSVASMGGLALKDEGVAITTGNSYTVVAAVEAINYALDSFGMLSQNTTAAVVGATGSIGRGTAILLSETVSQLILVGNPERKATGLERLFTVAGEVYKYIAGMIMERKDFKPGSMGFKLAKQGYLPRWDAPLCDFIRFAKAMNSQNGPVLVSTAIDEVLPLADVVVSATNSVGKIITPDNVKFGAVVCDVSRPPNVAEEMEKMRPDVLVIDGGVIEVPGLPSLGWDFGFEKGLAYACMAETMMLSLEHHYTNISLGSSGVNMESILLTRELARKHGFKLAKFRSFDRPLSSEKWERVLKARKSGGRKSSMETILA